MVTTFLSILQNAVDHPTSELTDAVWIAYHYDKSQPIKPMQLRLNSCGLLNQIGSLAGKIAELHDGCCWLLNAIEGTPSAAPHQAALSAAHACLSDFLVHLKWSACVMGQDASMK